MQAVAKLHPPVLVLCFIYIQILLLACNFYFILFRFIFVLLFCFGRVFQYYVLGVYFFLLSTLLYEDLRHFSQKNHITSLFVLIYFVKRSVEIIIFIVFLQNIESMVVEVTQDTNKKPMVLIRVLKDHDLVLEFSYVAERKKFLAKLENFLTGQKKNLETVPCFRDHMLMNAETKEKRKLRLEHFFREAYALTFGLKPGMYDG